jgi:hypothetical protein
MGICKICGKKTAGNLPLCRSCYKKQHSKTYQGKYSLARSEVHRSEGKDIKYQSDAEATVARVLEEQFGYKFDYDRAYPFPNNTTNKRFDFLILNDDGGQFRKCIFIEVKNDRHTDYTQEILEKERLCAKNKASLIYVNLAFYKSEDEIGDFIENEIDRILDR